MLTDVQNSKDKRGIPIDKVGIKNLHYPISVLDKKKSFQHTVADINMYVDLPHYFKGTHMSRFLEVLNEYRGEISIVSFPDILRKIKKVLNAGSASVEIEFPYFIEKTAPVSGKKSLMEYICSYKGTIKNKKAECNNNNNNNSNNDNSNDNNTTNDNNNNEDESIIIIGIKVPINTLCPCSKEISKYGAHNQRGVVSVSLKFSKLIWFEDIINDVESCASAPIYSLLKRADERFLTEHAYENPMFVEDIVRCVADILKKNKNIEWFRVEAENFESIHNHNAYAMTESRYED
ncbi:MAG: GTP cyclohydrolase I FolE2 [Candidatus Acididesulfobacter guangdongensis]|uniref:GTP cyclohydrolase FolE2 n=1 Tax=Acididesulfobacter guangdongensis TaxID=2597225 RepID=A0A519BFE2_ACIG2|nr:MAG: GTP cyclohydrolase I FolE2 [Candidatus Acididesulfobacter guangdongensis]